MTGKLTMGAIALGLSASAASAALHTHEPFDYAAGTVLDSNTTGNGVAGGTGWASGWDVQGQQVGYAAADATPLAHPDLQSSPGYAVGGGGFQSSGRRVDTGNTSVWNAGGYVADPFGASTTAWQRANIDQGTVWASFLFRKDTTSNGGVTFTTNNIAWAREQNGNPEVAIGRFGDNNLRVRTRDAANTDVANSIASPLTLGETYFVVLAFDLDADVLDVYVNPAAGTDAPAAPAVNDVPLLAGFGFKSVAFYPGSGTNNGAVDEIRIGTSFADVAPVAIPEPTALAGVAAAGLLALRRRR